MFESLEITTKSHQVIKVLEENVYPSLIRLLKQLD